MRISGVPYNGNLSLPAIAEKTLTAIGLPGLASHVISTRKWMVDSCDKQSQSINSEAPGSQSPSFHVFRIETKSIVVELSSPHVRDKVLRN